MQLDANSRRIRAARALRFATSDKLVPFRKPFTAVRGAVTDLEDGVLRGKRLSWNAFYKLLPEEEERRSTVMIEIAPGVFVNELTARRLGGAPDSAPRYETSEPPRAAIRQRSITAPHAGNDNRPARKTVRSMPDRAAQRAQVEASLKATADAIAAHAARMAERTVSAGQLSTPDRIARALEKHDPAMGKAFYRLRELMRAPLIAANDNFAAPDVEEKDRAWGLERKHNQSCMKPSPRALIAAYDRGAALGIQYIKPKKHDEHYRTWIGGRVGRKFVGILFNHGENGAVYYGDKRGRRRSVRYEEGLLTKRKLDPDQAKEERELQFAGLASYMALGGGPVLRGVLEDSYVIGRRRLQRYSPGVASYKPSDYARLCISDMKGIGEGATTAPAMPELAEMGRADAAQDFLEGLPTGDRIVVETMLVADSFTEVAAAAGKEPTGHNGKRLVLAALQKYSEKIAA